MRAMGLFLAALSLLGVICSADGSFWVGTSVSGSLSDLPAAVQLGSTHARLYVLWRYTQGRMDEWNPLMTVDKVRSNLSLISEWSSAQNWAAMDHYVGSVVQTGSITPIIEVFEGTVFGLPRINRNGTEELFDPNVVGVEVYLGYMYIVARATARRYSAAPYNVRLWQIENELNEAYLAGFAGQRIEKIANNVWREPKFLTTVLEVLREAVLTESPQSQVTMNFHTDISKKFHEIAFLPGFYLDALDWWAHLLDFIAIDAYPNMLVAEPIHPEIVGERVQLCRQALSKLGMPTKQVLVMETGYPLVAESLQTNKSLSMYLNFSDGNQADYAYQTVYAIQRAGGSGVIWFSTTPTAGMIPPGGYFTLDDAEAMKLVGEAYLDSNAIPIALWMAEPNHWNYVRTRFAKLFGAIDDNWGVLDKQAQPRPAFYALQKAYKELSAN
eukprot:ANDGO_03119.mRNA.1 hypothetical protein AMSG_04865